MVKGRATSRKVETWPGLVPYRQESEYSVHNYVLGSGQTPHQLRVKMTAMETEQNEHVVRCVGSGRSVPGPAQEEPNQRQRVNCIPQYSASGTTTV